MATRLETLVATMHQRDLTLADRMNLQTDAIIANQADRFEHVRTEHRGHRLDMYTFPERGVGLNRNNALMRSTAELCLFADDDVRYHDGSATELERAFDAHPEADVIVFNLEDPDSGRYRITDPFRVRFTSFMRFATHRIAARRAPLFLHGILFNLAFGGGTPHGSGEDTLFLHSCLKAGLRVQALPLTLGSMDDSRPSTWFSGFDEKYFYDKGTLYAVMDPVAAPALCLQFCARRRAMFAHQMPPSQALRHMLRAVRDVRRGR